MDSFILIMALGTMIVLMSMLALVAFLSDYVFYDSAAKPLLIASGIFIIVESGIVLWSLNACGDGKPVYEREWHKEEDVYTVRSSIDVNGSFCIGSGYVKTDLYYYFYTKNDNGYLMDKRLASRCYIVETDSKTPCLEYTREAWSNSHETIYVPVGTIRVTFSL